MDINIALADLASGIAIPIGAEYGAGSIMLLLAMLGNVPKGVWMVSCFLCKPTPLH
jgi:hypothetical protein